MQGRATLAALAITPPTTLSTRLLCSLSVVDLEWMAHPFVTNTAPTWVRMLAVVWHVARRFNEYWTVYFTLLQLCRRETYARPSWRFGIWMILQSNHRALIRAIICPCTAVERLCTHTQLENHHQSSKARRALGRISSVSSEDVPWVRMPLDTRSLSRMMETMNTTFLFCGVESFEPFCLLNHLALSSNSVHI